LSVLPDWISFYWLKADIESIMYAPDGTLLVLWRGEKNGVTLYG
jgi:hypothetical protein